MKSQVDKQVFYSLLETGVKEEPRYSIGCKSESLLEEWSQAKENIYKQFGNKLKISIPMETTADREIYTESIRELEEGLREEPMFNLVRIASRSLLGRGNISADVAVGNIIKGRDITIGGKTFKVGSKITKMLSSLVPKDLRNEFNIIYSRFLQSLQTTGQLVISIDPIDFIMMSENKSHWGSCHSVFGEYKAGALSYMLDEHTAIAYLSSNRTSYYENFDIEWNNKKWRQVVHINTIDGVFVQGKHYPSMNAICSEGVQKMLIEAMGMKNPEATGNLSKIQSLMEDYSNDDCQDHPLHYNDIMKNCDIEDRIVAVAEKGLDLYGLDTMFIGGKVRCLNDDCGEVVDDPAHFICSCCTDNYEEY